MTVYSRDPLLGRYQVQTGHRAISIQQAQFVSKRPSVMGPLMSSVPTSSPRRRAPLVLVVDAKPSATKKATKA
jgi:hypothetical protein